MNHGIFTTGRSASRADLVDRAVRHWEAGRKQAASQTNLPARSARVFSIALAREAGTEGTEVAKEVGRRLGWHIYDHELLEEIAQNMGLRTSLLSSVDERQQGWLRETAEALLSSSERSDWGPLLTESSYVHHLTKAVLALGIHGQCVIVGRGAGFILPVETTLRVRLVAPPPWRIATLSRTLNTKQAEAARRIRTTDRQRVDFVHDHFFKNPSDPANYDLVLNASRYSVDRCAELIIEGLKRLDAAFREL